MAKTRKPTPAKAVIKGFQSSLKKTASLIPSLNISNPAAPAAAVRHGAALVTELTQSGRATIAAVIGRGIAEAIPPRPLAGLLRGTVGLTSRQATAVLNFRTASAEAGLTGERLEAQALRYASKLLKQRVEMIARTESIRAVNAGKLEAWREAADEGLIQPGRTFRVWDADDNACEEVCQPMDGVRVAFEEAFILPDGTAVDGPPAHPSCRCSVSLVFGK